MRTRRIGASLAGILVAGACLGSPATAGTGTCFGETPTLTGTSGHDELEGTAGPDVIVGLGGRDVIRGRGGADRLCGEDGDDSGGGLRDRIYGGAGDDRLLGEHGPDHLDGQSGADRLNGGLGGGDSWPNELVGGRGHDYLNGGDAGDLFWPGRGNDFAGGGGDASVLADALYFNKANRGVTVNMTRHTVRGQGKDKIFGIDEVHGSWHQDVLIGDEDKNYLWGECADPYGYCNQHPHRGAHDVIKGKGRGDVLDGRAGPDRVLGGKGDDLVFGGFGTDSCKGEDVNECENNA